jgi:transposase
MSNALSEEKRQQVIALGRLGWPLRRIEQETGVRRETASAYLKAAGIGVRPPRAWGRRPPAKPANEVITGFGVGLSGVDSNSNGHSPTTPSACEPFREPIELGLSQGRNAMAIWQDLVADHGFQAGYLSVQRFVRRLRGNQPAQACAVICTPVGEEAQVDYGNKGPMVRYERTGKYRRTRLFVLTLGYSRKAVRLLTFQSSSRIWAELHEKAFCRLGGTPRVVVLDNLKEGVLTPDFYEPTLNPLYREVLAHYGVVPLPCRIQDPDRNWPS